MVLTLFDWMIIIAAVAAAFNAVQRGLSREMLHTLLLLVGMVAGALFLKDPSIPGKTPEDAPLVAAWFVNFSFYLIMLYVLLWVVIRTLGLMFVANFHDMSYRSKFWGGVLALTKVVVLGLGLLLAYAVATPLPPVERLGALPRILSSSALVNIGDVQVQYMYGGLVRAGWLADEKPLEAAPSSTIPSPTTPLLPPPSPTVP